MDDIGCICSGAAGIESPSRRNGASLTCATCSFRHLLRTRKGYKSTKGAVSAFSGATQSTAFSGPRTRAHWDASDELDENAGILHIQRLSAFILCEDKTKKVSQAVECCCIWRLKQEQRKMPLVGGKHQQQPRLWYSIRQAVASSANFGLVGNGRLHLASIGPGPGGPPALTLERQFDTQDGLYDVAWSEIHENQIVTASGDGTIKLWDVTLKINGRDYRTSPYVHGTNIPAKSSQ
ncbi:hypothetical protein NM688_g7580 [Phlebia brevispora]|uniref:Uncharacterized protein n=1 Tax=Phlebia brevispora TaxID=194682 RepID=A0ACC1S3U5_9APHY|nr:hypothetical protein NM688_g7580 [Phlebia brevispora]